MAIQQLTQPILNNIAAFDATQAETITFTVIGGAQVIGNRLVISNNQTGAQVYNQIQATMKLEHTIPANTLTNGGYYNAVVYTINNGNEESVASVAVPFYCYSSPSLTINNIPVTGTIQNGTYTFTGNYAQLEQERLDSYQFTLYDSNKDVLSQTPLIYYDTDSSLSYTFRGMSNDTAYYIELTGETVNNTQLTSGLVYFTVRYEQPASFAICDLVNDCSNGYIQVSSNIVAIDGESNPSPPIYIDDKEVDLRDKDAWVRWSSGFRIKDDFTMRIWGRQFGDYGKIVTLTNDLNTETNPNKIELKWMVGDIIKKLPTYSKISGLNVNVGNSEPENIQNLNIGGNSIQLNTVSVDNPASIYSTGDNKNLINVNDFELTYSKGHFIATNTYFELEPNYVYTLSFDYVINDATTDVYFVAGYGRTTYLNDITAETQYLTRNEGRNTISFIVPEMPQAVDYLATEENNEIITQSNDNIIMEDHNYYLWVKFAQTQILADVDISISNIQLERGSKLTNYQSPNAYNITPTIVNKNLYDYNGVFYIKKENCAYSSISNGYNAKVKDIEQESSLGIGLKNILEAGKTYSISYQYLGNLTGFKLYITNKGKQNTLQEIEITNHSFTAPDNIYDLQLVFSIDNSDAANYIQIWNIQIESGDKATEYETRFANTGNITIGEPLRGIDSYKDLICTVSPNLLNNATQSANVESNTTYYFNQAGDTQYYLWYYNEEGNLITFVDEEGKEAHGVVITKGQFTTHENCIKITITKSDSATAEDVSSSEIINNQISISLGNNETIYYPYVSSPSVIKYFVERTLTGIENWALGNAPTQTDTLYFVLSNPQTGLNNDIVNCMSNIFKGYDYTYLYNNDVEGIAQSGSQIAVRVSKTKNVSDVDTFKAFLGSYNIKGIFRVFSPTVTPLNETNVTALSNLSTYTPISNAYTDNNSLGTVMFNYVNGYSEQQVQNNYVMLKCWNGNIMPYVIHSNYIDFPKDTDKIFIWVRRKQNIFDLRIENLGNYTEEEKPIDIDKPIVTMDIDQTQVTSTEIPITIYAVDDSGLKTIRFSKNNGQSWDEVITVDGLSITRNYTFKNLRPNTTYTIRAEVIDISGNIGGISQRVKTR